jgi:predicted RNase H-like nuclease (RuvC/YqgF family)
LRAVETSNEDTRDQSQAKLVEARMRADLLHMTSQRDEALGNLAQSQRHCKLVEDELYQTKIKLSKVQQEKMQVERDQRATLSLAKSLQGNVHSDADYYKRKVTELNTHIQGLSAVLTEKNRQIEELRRQLERNMSQNRLAAFRDDRKKRAAY